MFHQKGVFRTNCMDCLDRTNVIQSLVAWENLIQGERALNTSLQGARAKVRRFLRCDITMITITF